VGEAAMYGWFALGTGLLRKGAAHPRVGAHCVGEAAMCGWFALGTGLLRKGADPPPRRSPLCGRSSEVGDRAERAIARQRGGSPWGQGSYEGADPPPRRSPLRGRSSDAQMVRPGDRAPTKGRTHPRVGAHSVGEAAMYADGSPWGQGSYERADPPPRRSPLCGRSSDAQMVRPGDRAPTRARTRPRVGAHSVGEAAMRRWFALGTGLLRGRGPAPA
jgi:hypothetical protein